MNYCLEDSDSIVFYLFAKEGSEIAMLLYEVYWGTQQLFEI